MRRRRGKRIVTMCGAAAVFCCGCSLTAVEAQAVFCNSSGDANVRRGAIRVASEQVVTGEPYQAQAVTELQQTTADGTHITQNSTAMIARDSEGRTMRTETLEGIHPWISKSGSSGQSNKTTLTTIFDPVAREHIDYTSDSSVAHVIGISAPAEDPASASGQISGEMDAAGPALFGGGPPLGAPAVAIPIEINPLQIDSPEQSNATKSSLGTKTIDGVQATGTRTTTIIPAGAIGNDRNIIVTQDTWYSPELEMVLESVHRDPRFGVSIYSVINLQREEPDASLFQVPPGYTVQHVNGQFVIGSNSGTGAK
jgi:hypothetical protein